MTARLLITNVHLLDPEAGTLSDASRVEIADGRIAAADAGRPLADIGVLTGPQRHLKQVIKAG